MKENIIGLNNLIDKVGSYPEMTKFTPAGNAEYQNQENLQHYHEVVKELADISHPQQREISKKRRIFENNSQQVKKLSQSRAPQILFSQKQLGEENSFPQTQSPSYSVELKTVVTTQQALKYSSLTRMNNTIHSSPQLVKRNLSDSSQRKRERIFPLTILASQNLSQSKSNRIDVSLVPRRAQEYAIQTQVDASKQDSKKDETASNFQFLAKLESENSRLRKEVNAFKYILFKSQDGASSAPQARLDLLTSQDLLLHLNSLKRSSEMKDEIIFQREGELNEAQRQFGLYSTQIISLNAQLQQVQQYIQQLQKKQA